MYAPPIYAHVFSFAWIRSWLLPLRMLILLTTLPSHRPITISSPTLPLASEVPSPALTFVKLPLSFIPNLGQFDSNSQYQARACAVQEEWMKRLHRQGRCDLSLFCLGLPLLAAVLRITFRYLMDSWFHSHYPCHSFAPSRRKLPRAPVKYSHAACASSGARAMM